MKTYKIASYVLLGLALACALILPSACDTASEGVDDAKMLIALQKVKIEYDSMSYEIGLPDGALSGKSFDSLLKEDSAKYSDPANYTIDLAVNMKADNTSAGAQDAKFDGGVVDVVMDTIESAPIKTIVDPFEVAANEKEPVAANGTMNLATHKATGLYIFRQTVDGNDLATTLKPTLNYQIGPKAGQLPLPPVSKDIPTRASDEMKAFLQGLLDSGIFDQ